MALSTVHREQATKTSLPFLSSLARVHIIEDESNWLTDHPRCYMLIIQSLVGLFVNHNFLSFVCSLYTSWLFVSHPLCVCLASTLMLFASVLSLLFVRLRNMMNNMMSASKIMAPWSSTRFLIKERSFWEIYSLGVEPRICRLYREYLLNKKKQFAVTDVKSCIYGHTWSSHFFFVYNVKNCLYCTQLIYSI